MATFRGKLSDRDRLVAGVQAVIYIPNGNKVDTDITDEFGYFQFNDIAPGEYRIYFYGRGYEEKDFLTVFVTDKSSNTQFFIRPLSGTVIKNSTGSLSVELREIFNGTVSTKTSGPIKLYVDNEGTFELLKDQAGVTATTDYAAEIDASAIDGTLDVYAVADANLDTEFIYDTITLADVSDGVGFIGWVTPSSFVTIENEDGSFSPSSITLTPHFAFEGQELDLEADNDFSFDLITPATDAGNGISVDPDTGVITVTTEDYFDTEDLLTGNWEATYLNSGKTYNFSVAETIYKAAAGANAKLLTISADSYIFKSDQDDEITSPNEIILTGLKQNIAENPK